MTLQGQVQAAGSAKAVTSKGSRTALPTLQKAPHSFSRQLATLGQSLDTAVTLQGQVYRQLCPPKLSLLRDPGLPSQRFKAPRTAFHGQLATLGQSLETAVTLQGQVQAAGSAKAVTSKGSRTALPTLQKAPHSFSRQLATLGQSLETAVTRQGQVQAVLAAKAVTSKGSRTALPTLQRAPHSFSWAACDFRSKLGHSCDTPGASTGSFRRQSCHF